MIMIGTLLTIFLMQQATALECPDYASAPACPASKSTLLDETYPVQAYVISNSPAKRSEDSTKVTVKFLETISESFNHKNVPQMILSVSTKEEFDKLSAELDENLKQKKVSEEDRKKVLGQLTHNQAANYTWQQDYFESFVDLKTGRPVLRQVESYSRAPGKVEDLANTGQTCGVTAGPGLKRDLNGSTNGEMGGNIEGAPGGLCLIGDNQGIDYAKSFCENEGNILQLEVSWLKVGHVDEVYKIIPTNVDDGRPKECQFSLMAASPKKALELMSQPRESSNPIFDFDPSAPQERIDSYLKYKPTNETARKVCNIVQLINDEKQKTTPGGTGQKVKSVFLQGLGFLINDVLAGAKSANAPATGTVPAAEQRVNQCPANIQAATNYEFAKKIKEDAELHSLNMAIQESIDKDKLLIKEKILSRLPQCKQYYDEMDVPNLFSAHGGGTITDEKTGKKILKDNANVYSLYPNPTNSVIMNKTVLLPDPENKTFSNYLAEEIKKRGMKSSKLSVWDYAHLAEGNLHCATHSIPYCSGVK